eukprot:comp21093_c0_seq1/m.28470 comp21093_c0_seq1/g.28470  ORF comp21093_c0_seq1/g.28470 comp21093_c0_seq1/m.28470 type:complete len:458 (-) comp21093_c0_seq1:387-1760(-)
MRVLGLLCGVALFGATSADDTRRRFEFRHSLRGPFPLYQKNRVMGWDVEGSTLVNEKSVRLVPSAQNRKGRIWNHAASNMTAWEFRVEFMIFGKKVGADGMGIWYSKRKDGGDSVFGGPDKWEGLGIFIDTFDNNQKGDNPTIYGIINDGTQGYHHNNDGADQTLGSCQAPVRNSLAPVQLLVTYKDTKLEVKYDTTRTNSYTTCFTATNVHLPPGYFFGVTAATGGLADDHDLIKFETFNLAPSREHHQTDVIIDEHEQLSDEELRRLEEDFKRQQMAMGKSQAMYQEKHADELEKQRNLEDDHPVGVGVYDVEQVLELQRHLSRQVEESFMAVNRRIEEIVLNFQQSFDDLTRSQPHGGENSAANLLPTIDGLLKQLQHMDTRLQDAESRLQWEQLSVQEELKAVVREDIGKLHHDVTSTWSWSALFLYLIAANAVFFVCYLIWKRKVDEEKKFS